MKKIKWYFIAIALVAISSAFVTTKKISGDPAWGVDPVFGLQQIDRSLEGSQFLCNEGESEYCIYEDQSLTTGVTGKEDKDFIYLDGK